MRSAWGQARLSRASSVDLYPLIVAAAAGLAVLVSALVFRSSLCPADASAPVNQGEGMFFLMLLVLLLTFDSGRRKP